MTSFNFLSYAISVRSLKHEGVLEDVCKKTLNYFNSNEKIGGKTVCIINY
jgi:hypothetical protein